jgi:hypothetical protein
VSWYFKKYFGVGFYLPGYTSISLPNASGVKHPLKPLFIPTPDFLHAQIFITAFRLKFYAHEE